LACRLVLSLRESDEARGWGSASTSGVIVSGGSSSDRSSRTKINSKNSHKTAGGVQISTQTMQAYCSDSSGTVHLDYFPSAEDEKNGRNDSSVELNELDKSPRTLTDEKIQNYDVEKGRM